MMEILAVIVGVIFVALLGRSKKDVPAGGLEAVWRWRPQAVTAAARYNLRPSWILAIIDQESDGDPTASRPSGEYGLGQLKPIAARDVGDRSVPLDPKKQIMQMAEFLRLQLRRTDGDLFEALRAYKEGFKGKDQSREQAARATAYANSVQRQITIYELSR